MNNILILALAVSLYAPQAIAEEGKGHVGLASVSTTVSITSSFGTNDFTWFGTGITGGYDVTDIITVSALLYPKLTEDLDSNSEMSGFELNARVGPNSRGFTYYGELGVFSDSYKHKLNAVPSAKFSGFSFGGGIGYNWRDVNLTWNIIQFRSTSDYEAWLSTTTAATVDVFSGSLSLSYRF